MSDPDDGNKTVFRPSPLAARKAGGTLQPGQTGRTAPPGAWPGQSAPVSPPPAAMPPGGLAGAAAPALALATAMRSGGASTPLPQLHAEATQAIGRFEAAIAAYPEAIRQRATYAVGATIDDVAQHVAGGGDDAAEWARRSMATQFSGAEPGEDRFGQIVDEAMRNPAQNRDLIDLLLACLAAGFEGASRGDPTALQALGDKLKGAPGSVAQPAPAPATATRAPVAEAAAAPPPRPAAPAPEAAPSRPSPPPVWTPSNKAAVAPPPPRTGAAPAPTRKKGGRGLLIGLVVVVLLLAAGYAAARWLLPPGTLRVGSVRLSAVETSRAMPAAAG